MLSNEVSIVMTCIIHKISLSLKVTRISKRFLGSITDLIDFYLKKLIFFTLCNDGKF